MPPKTVQIGSSLCHVDEDKIMKEIMMKNGKRLIVYPGSTEVLGASDVQSSQDQEDKEFQADILILTAVSSEDRVLWRKIIDIDTLLDDIRVCEEKIFIQSRSISGIIDCKTGDYLIDLPNKEFLKLMINGAEENMVRLVPVGEKAHTYTYARIPEVPEDHIVRIPLVGDLPVLKRTPLRDEFPRKYNSLLMIAMDHEVGWEDLYIYWIEERREWIGITDLKLNAGQWDAVDPAPVPDPVNGPYRLSNFYAKKIMQAYNVPEDIEISWREILRTSPTELEGMAVRAIKK